MRFVFSLLIVVILLGCSGKNVGNSKPSERNTFVRGLKQLGQEALPPPALLQLRQKSPDSPWARRAKTLIVLSEERTALQLELLGLNESLLNCQDESLVNKQRLEACTKHYQELKKQNKHLQENLENLRDLLIEMEAGNQLSDVHLPGHH